MKQLRRHSDDRFFRFIIRTADKIDRAVDELPAWRAAILAVCVLTLGGMLLALGIWS